MIKNILLQASRSYNPYVQSNEIWGAGQTLAGELDNDFNARKFVSVGSDTNWELIDQYGGSIAIKTDGTLWTWGSNSVDGRLGFGDGVNRSSPTQLGTRTWVSASAGNVYVHAIRSDGTLWGWGSQASFGAVLGDGTASNRSSPVQIGTHTWKQISNGQQSSLAIRSDDTLWGWGGSSIGELGNGEFPGTFGIIDNVSGPWNDVAASRSFTIAVKSDGKLYGWGLNTSGQLGTGDVVYRSSAVQIGTLSTWVSASNNTVSTLAIKTDGTLWVWGASTNGVLGLNDAINRSSPVQVGTLNNWKDVSVSLSHTIAVKTDGTLWSWGTNQFGELGNRVFSLLPASPDLVWASASFGNNFVHALKTDNTMWTWGINTLGTLGLNDVTTRSSPVQLGTLTWKMVSNGNNTTLAIRNDDTLWSWGRGLSGEIGLNLTPGTNRSSPVQIGTRTWKYVSAEGQYVLAIRSDDTLWAWGANASGQLGLNDTIARSSPVQTGNSSADWYKVFSGNNHTLSVKTDGTLWAWGRNIEGQLGDATNISTSLPIQIGLDSDWASVYISNNSSFGLKTDGTLFVWGQETANGLLGLNSINVNRSNPTQLGASGEWSEIYTNVSATTIMGKKIDGSLWVWGTPSFLDNTDISNVSGGARSSPVQIGTRTDWANASIFGSSGAINYALGITNAGELYTGPGTDISITLWSSGSNSSPVQIGTETNWASVNANHSLMSSALKNDGTLWTWGYQFYGLNPSYIDNTKVSEPKQTTVDTWNKFILSRSLTTNPYTWGGIKTNGTLWIWGLNSSGEIGNNSVVTRSSPVQVGTRLYTDIDIGQKYVAAIRNDGTLWTWGRNNLSQLGTANTTDRSSPVQVGDKTDWYKIFAGETHTAGIRTAWNNDLYTAGVGTTFNSTYEGINGWTYPRKSPILVSQVNPWREIYSGLNHFIAIKTDGTLWGWGGDAFGQIGIGTVATVRSSPVQIGTRNDWSSISAGSTYTLGVRTDGTLWGWGINTSGELGLNVATNRSSPVQIGTRTWSKILASAQATSLAVRSDGTLWTWGQYPVGLNAPVINRSSPVQIGTETNWLSPQNGKYFAGTGSPVFARKINKSLYVYAAGEGVSNGISFYKSSPVQVTSTRNWKSVNAGNSFTIAISTSGSMWAWGTQANGVIGNNTVTASASQESPVQIGTLTTWASASAGEGNVVAIRNDNTIWTWGANTAGQLAQNDTISRSSPVQVGTLTNWLRVSAGRSHVMAIKTDGTLWGWGINTNNNIGDGTITSRSSAVQIGTRTDWSKISAGDGHTMAITTGGELYAMGMGTVGQQGTNNVSPGTQPQRVGTSTWTDVAAGHQMTAAVRSDGTLWAWGQGTDGRLGLLRNRSLPNYVDASTTFTSISTGDETALAIAYDGKLWSWGGNGNGALGFNDAISRSSPVQVGTRTWNKISVGDFSFVLAVRSDNTLWSWGGNAFGNLGFNDTTNRSSPVQVGTLSNWKEVSSGYLHSHAVKTDGTLWGWGYNALGGLGLGDAVNRSSPVQVGTLTNWSKVGSIFATAFGLKTDGTLWSWGRGGEGQRGSNNALSTSSPVQIGTRTWSFIADGGGGLPSMQTYHMLAVRSDGTLWTWGKNDVGQLGLNDLVSRSSPVQIGTETNWASGEVGGSSTMAIKTNGTLWAWGLNTVAMLGLGNTINRSSPVQVGTLSSWVSASIGEQHTVLLQNNGYVLTTGASNQSGEPGFETNRAINRSNPVQLGIDTNWQKVNIGNTPILGSAPPQILAQKTDGTLWTWGGNTVGNLGDGTLTNKSSPVQLGNDTTWVNFDAEQHFVGIKQY